MANTRDPVAAYTYFDDKGTGWRVDLTSAVATAGGFAAAASGLAYLPKHAKMRHVGLHSGVKRGKCPFSNIAGAYQNGGTLNFDGLTWNVTGRIGEKFRLS